MSKEKCSPNSFLWGQTWRVQSMGGQQPVKECEQKHLSLNKWVYVPFMLIGFMTKYCSAKQSCLVFHPGAGYHFVTSWFIVHFQRILRFLKASGKRWFFVLICFLKSVHAKVLTRWSPVRCISWHVSLPFWKSVLILLVFCFVPSSNNSTLTMYVKNSAKSYFYLMTGSNNSFLWLTSLLPAAGWDIQCLLHRIVVIQIVLVWAAPVKSSTQVLRALKTLFLWFVFIPPLRSMSS